MTQMAAFNGKAGKALKKARAGVNALGNTAGKAATRVADAAKDAGAVALDAAEGAAKGAFSAFGGEVALEQEGNLKAEDGSYELPEPVLSDTELDELDPLSERWEKATAPGVLAKAGGKAMGMLPESARNAIASATDSISGKEYYKATLEIVAKGFSAIESQAARMTVSPTYVVNKVNQGPQEQKVSEVAEICLLRSYDVARIAGDERTQHLALALTEGAATGTPGFPGIPFNIVLSMFLFFRAVQSVAMFYGYDVKAEPAEMIIAGDVLMAAFGGGEKGPNGKVATGAIGKIMAISEAETVKQVVAKGWGAAASHGGIPLLIVQMRALANKAAEKAIINAGQKTLEENVFSNVFKQIGKRLTQSAVKGAVPVIGGVIGALFDTGLMDRVLTVADLFYHKRFVIEKPARVRMLAEGISFEEAAIEVEPEDYEA